MAAAAAAITGRQPNQKPSRVSEMMRVDVAAIERQYRPEGSRAAKLYPELTEVEKFDMSMSVEARTVEGLSAKYQSTAYGRTSATASSSSSTVSYSAAGRGLSHSASSGAVAVNNLLKEMASTDPETSRSALCAMLMVVKSKESHEDVKPL